MEIVKGNVASKSRKGNSIKVNDDWYSCYSASDLDHVNWKDDVEFMYEQKGKYKNIKGDVTVTSKGGSSGGSKPSGGGGYNNTGVELGHASNLAMRMMEQGWVNEAGPAAVGSPEYYKQFAEYTMGMYKVMKMLRGKVDAGELETTKSETKTPPPSTDIDDEDIF